MKSGVLGPPPAVDPMEHDMQAWCPLRLARSRFFQGGIMSGEVLSGVPPAPSTA